MLTALRELESATVDLELHGLGITFPVPGMMMRHWNPAQLSPELNGVREKYERALTAALSARSKTSGQGGEYVDYYIGRFKFGLAYFKAMDAARKGGTAEASKDYARALEY